VRADFHLMPHALQKVPGPLGPGRHRGVSVVWHCSQTEVRDLIEDGAVDGSCGGRLFVWTITGSSAGVGEAACASRSPRGGGAAGASVPDTDRRRAEALTGKMLATEVPVADFSAGGAEVAGPGSMIERNERSWGNMECTGDEGGSTGRAAEAEVLPVALGTTLDSEEEEDAAEIKAGMPKGIGSA
jgi:hypothetical protein